VKNVKREISIDYIQKNCFRLFSIGSRNPQSKQGKDVVQARQLAMFLLRNLPKHLGKYWFTN
jgi:chromosomal replication initiation ATPase DnaA